VKGGARVTGGTLGCFDGAPDIRAPRWPGMPGW
jgi:hypothetical protein